MRISKGMDRNERLLVSVRQGTRSVLEKAEFAAAMQETALAGLSPLAVLGRGYSIITNESGQSVNSAASLSEGESVVALFHDGSADMKVGARRVKKENE
jgi:exodeoxyribonuclease VII large subunit